MTTTAKHKWIVKAKVNTQYVRLVLSFEDPVDKKAAINKAKSMYNPHILRSILVY